MGTRGNVAFFRRYDDLILGYQFDKIARNFGDPGETIPDINDYKGSKIKEGSFLDSYRVGWKGLIFSNYNVYRVVKQFLIEQGGYEENKSLFFCPTIGA